MPKLILAEKPSQARDIAKVIGIKRSDDGFIELVNGDYISWAIGHLLELAEPEEYVEAWGGPWAWVNLPMIPEKWKTNVNKKTAKQFRVVQGLLKRVSDVIIATDAGREGELIARDILDYCKFKGGVQRLWTSSLVAKDIKAALDKLLPGSKTEPLYEAALARRGSDWMVGLSGTRGATLAAKQRGTAYPLGRVQTPTLALIVRRERDITTFKSVTYYELEASVTTKSGKTLKMTHAPDEKNRITDRVQAEALKKQANKAQGPLKVENKSGTESPPLPYSLPQLQKDANRIFKFSSKTTLQHAQSLYDKKALSYPRTDCQYLAESQKEEVRDVLAVVSRRFPDTVKVLDSAGVRMRSTVFNDAKLTDHHGIIPTTQYVEDITGDELKLYTLVCQRYLQVLGQDCLFDSTKVLMDANGVPFKATGKAIRNPGWQALKLL